MPPKKQSRTAGLLQFFAKQQQERLQKESSEHDDSCQILFDSRPTTSSAPFPKTPETPKNATKWGESLENAAKTSGSTTGRDWQNPFSVQVGRKSAEKNKKETDLINHGFDNIHGKGLFYPIDEPIRTFEENLVKCAASSNCCIALPSSAPSSSSRICAITVFNFLKWFPRCRVLLVSDSDTWHSSLRQIGLEAQTTKLTTVTQFRKAQVGRILVCASPQCALKVVESVEAREFLDEIRLVMMELKPNECCSKYKPILNALIVRDVFFRCVVLTTATSNASRRTASITKRQLMITNLQLSDWVEQSDGDFAFRTSSIPAGVEVKTWKMEEGSSSELAEIVLKFEALCAEKIERLARDSIIPSKSIKKLIWTCWKTVKTMSPPQNLDDLELAELLVTCYKYLLIDGVVSARNFVKKHVTQNSKLAETSRLILEIFGGISEFPAKFQILANAIEAFLKMDNHVRGVVLCRDAEQAAEIQNFLEFQISVKSTSFVRIVEEGAGRNQWQLSRISTVFHDRKSPKVLILPVKLRDFIGYSDSLPVNEVTFVAAVSRECLFNFRLFAGAYLLVLNDPLEMLRKEDGRLIVDDGKFASRKETKNMKLGAVERYDFKFESSQLRLDVSQFPIRFFYPRGTFDDSAGISRLGKTHIEMTSKEHAELFRRIKNPDFSKFQNRKRKLCVVQMQDKNKTPLDVEEMDDEQVFWNQDLQYLGEVKSSKQSERLTKYLKSGTLSWVVAGDRRRYQCTNEISCEKRLLHLNRLLESLDAHFEGIA